LHAITVAADTLRSLAVELGLWKDAIQAALWTSSGGLERL
jgi:hypothetical protein